MDEQSDILQERFAVYPSAHLPLVTHTRLWGMTNAATVKCPKEQTDISKCLFNLLAAGWHLKRCYLTSQAGPRRTALGLCFWEYVFPWKRAASRKDPLCSGVAAYCNTLVWQRRLQCPCSCPGQQPGTLAEGASSRVQDFYESQTCVRGPIPSSVCSWFYQPP